MSGAKWNPPKDEATESCSMAGQIYCQKKKLVRWSTVAFSIKTFSLSQERGCAHFDLYILEEPAKNADCVLVNVEISDQIDHSKGLTFWRHTSSSVKEVLKVMLREFTPMHLHTKKKKKKNCCCRWTEISECNLENGMDTKPFLDCQNSERTRLEPTFQSSTASVCTVCGNFSFYNPHVLNWSTPTTKRLAAEKYSSSVPRCNRFCCGPKPEDCKNVLYYAVVQLHQPQEQQLLQCQRCSHLIRAHLLSSTG